MKNSRGISKIGGLLPSFTASSNTLNFLTGRIFCDEGKIVKFKYRTGCTISPRLIKTMQPHVYKLTSAKIEIKTNFKLNGESKVTLKLLLNAIVRRNVKLTLTAVGEFQFSGAFYCSRVAQKDRGLHSMDNVVDGPQ